MHALRRGWIIARQRLGLTVTLFIGDALVRLAALGGVVVLMVALATGMALGLEEAKGSSSLLSASLAALGFLTRPMVLLGVLGAAGSAGALAFLGSTLLRAGLLGTVLDALGHDPPFRLRRFFRLAAPRFRPLIVLGIIEAVVPFAGLAFALPALIGASSEWAAGDLGLRSYLGLPLGLAGASLLSLSMSAWLHLARVQVALRPLRPVSRALAETAPLLSSRAPDLLRFGLLAGALTLLPALAHFLATNLIGALAPEASTDPMLQLARSIFELGFGLLAVFVSVVIQASFVALFLRWVPDEALSLPRKEEAPPSVDVRELYLSVERGTRPDAGKAPEPATPALPRVGLRREDVFRISRLLAEQPPGPAPTKGEGGQR